MRLNERAPSDGESRTGLSFGLINWITLSQPLNHSEPPFSFLKAPRLEYVLRLSSFQFCLWQQDSLFREILLCMACLWMLLLISKDSRELERCLQPTS